MRPKKKSRGFTALCSLIPGAAEMYMGFMKLGFSIMAAFFVCIIIPTFFNVADAIFGITAVVVWFYGFFHARNMVNMEDADFCRMYDHYIWEEFMEDAPLSVPKKKIRKIVAAVLILFGFVTLWSNFKSIIFSFIPDQMWEQIYPVVDQIPSMMVAILIIIAGVSLMIGKKNELEVEETEETKKNVRTYREPSYFAPMGTVAYGPLPAKPVNGISPQVTGTTNMGKPAQGAPVVNPYMTAPLQEMQGGKQ